MLPWHNDSPGFLSHHLKPIDKSRNISLLVSLSAPRTPFDKGPRYEARLPVQYSPEGKTEGSYRMLAPISIGQESPGFLEVSSNR